MKKDSRGRNCPLDKLCRRTTGCRVVATPASRTTCYHHLSFRKFSLLLLFELVEVTLSAEVELLLSLLACS